MIQAKDFRIGNYIIEEDGCIAKIIGFKPFDHSIRCDEEEGCELLIDVYEADGTINTERLTDSQKSRPIALTPEWLTKMGYTKDSIDKKWYKSPNNLPPIYCWRMGDYGMDGLPLSAKSIQYVHQLQNLYFVLTGEELTII